MRNTLTVNFPSRLLTTGMFSEHEDGIMKAPGIISERSSRWRTFPPSARVRKSASHVKSLRWFHILLLVVLLAGQASCQSTTVPTPASPTSANVPSTENYFFDITVNFNGEKDESDIDDWLEEVFQNGLQDCVPATPVPTTPQTTTATSTVLNSSTTSTTTTASTATSTATTSNATTSTATTSTTATSTATTSTAATSTATTSNATTSTATTSTATSTATTSTAATSTATTSNATTSTATSTASTSTAAPSTATSIASTSTAAPSTATSTASTSTAAPSTATSTASTSTAAPSTAASTASTSTSKATASTSTAAPSTAASTASTATSKATTTTSTAAPSTPATSTAAKSTATSTTATSTAAPSTPATSTAAKSTATSTTAKSTATTATSTLATSTAATSTSPQDTSTTIAATTQATSTQPRKTTTTTTPPTPPNNAVIVQTIIVPAPPPTLFTGLPAADEANIQPTNVPDGSQGNRARVVRELKDRSVQTSRISKRQTTGIIQDLDTTCPLIANKKADCSVTLSLNQRVPPCCILSTLCKASKSSTEFDAVGRKVDIINPIQNECNTDSPEENSCTNTGGASQSCAASEFQSKCDAVEKNCGCSSYCNKTEAYYAYEISIQDPEISFQHVSSLISKLKVTPDCSTETDQPCPPPRVAAEYKDSSLTCGSTTTNLQSCRVVSNFKSAIGVCNVDEAVRYALKDEKQIKITRQVTRAAICGNSEFSLQVTELAWKQVPYKPADFCPAGGARVFECENGETLLILLDKTCGLQTTTPGPNVTTMQPNTTMSVNVTTTPLNTTTNATVPLNTTTTPTDAEGQANALLDLTKDVSMLNSSQINQLVSQLERLLSGPNVSLALGNTSVQIVSNLLGATPEVLSESSNRIIGIVDTVGNKLVLGEAEETLLSPDVALSVKPADGTNFQETVFSVLNPNDVQLTGGSRRSRSVRVDSSIPQGSIRLPPSLTQNLSAEAQQLASRVLFNFYQKSTVFQDKSLGERRLISGILGASVANLSISNLQDNVVINLRNTEPIPANYVARCVFWDFSMNDRSGGWNPDGCSLQNSTDNETVCGCNHLTSFAILLDLDRTPLTSRVQATILTFITYIGCGVSAIFLAITLLTYLAFGKLRKDIPSKILIQLCLALLLLNLVFLVDAWLALYPDAVGLCISTAWFLHYFLLVSFTWMGLEAVHMYLALVKVFNSYISRYMLKFSLVGWGVPMIVVIIVIAINKNNYGLISYGRFSDGSTDEFCWIKDDIAFYVAVVAYFGGIFLFNLVMFVVVLVQLCRIKRQNPHNTIHRTTLQDIRSVAGITILLGLTWGFAFFAWGPVNLAFMYLFAIFNSLHGFFIFVFHCAVKENVRRQWRTYLCCGRMRLAENSEWSRTATQKTMKKSSVTRLTPERSSKLSKSNNSSSSFLVTDSTEHLNGIGSPFDDRAITANEEPSTDVILNEINRQCRDQQAS